MQSIKTHCKHHQTTASSHWPRLALLMLLWLLTGCTLPPLEPGRTLEPALATSTPISTVAPVLDNTCDYAVVVRDEETKAPIENAKITLEYQLNAFVGHTDSEGRYRGIFLCAEEAPRYQLRIEANDYQVYSTELTLMETINEIYLISTATRFCPYVISVLDEADKAPIADAKVRIEYKLYYAAGYTDDEGRYNSELPCAEELPQISVAVYADGYKTYSAGHTLQGETKEIRLTFAATPTPTNTPTPTPTATLFPPRAEGEVLVLVADILVPGCINDPACSADPDDVTQRLVSTMRDDLESYPEIRIERLRQFIEEEGGSERAMKIGRSPEFDATFVIWGNYLEAPEVYLFFDIMNTELPFFGGSYDQAYGPTQIQQPSMFEFKASLGQQWAYVTAFATGLTLFQAGNRHHEAEPLFNTAAQVLDEPENLAVDSEMVRYLYFYHGTNYLHLGRANLAEPDLYALYKMLESEHLAQDELSGMTLGNLGIVYSDLGEDEKAIKFSGKALAISHEINDRRGEGSQLNNLGNAYSNLGDYEKAIEFYEQALAISQEIKNRGSEGHHLGNLGGAYSGLGESEKAIGFFEQALAISQEIKNRRNEAIHLGSLGITYASLGEYERAIQFSEQALAISREIKNRKNEAVHLGNLGNAYAYLGEYEKAIEFSKQALVISREIKDRRNEGYQLGNLGGTHSSLGEHEKAIEFFKQALAISREIKNRRNEGNQLGNLGIAYAHLGEYEKAIEFYEQTLAIAREIKNRGGEGKNLGNLGVAYLNLGEYEKAIEFYKQALVISREIKNRGGEGHDLVNLGIAYSSLGEHEKAIDYLTESYAILSQIKSPTAGLAYQWLGVTYNNACWASSVNREAEIALPYCEEAVKHDPQSSFFRDGRGLAYALLGEMEKAIADFQFFVDGLKELNNSDHTGYIEARQGWIDALTAGENPFTDDVLAALREE